MPLDLKPLVEAIRGLPPLADEDGETRTVEVLPPGTPDELERFAVACGGALPPELEEFLSLSAGLRGVLEFEPEPHLRECARVNTLRVYDYGNGDWMGLEPGDARCRIWWLGHDPYFMVLHAESITSLLQAWLETISGLIEAGTSLDELDLFRPAVESRGLSRSDVPCADDAALAAFLERLPEGSLVHDLRRAAPRTEIPIESSQGGGVERHGLVFAFPPRPVPTSIRPLPVAHYLSGNLPAEEREILEQLPAGCLVLHERDLPVGGVLDSSGAHPEQDTSWKPPFHILWPRPKPWWRFW